MNFTSDQLNKLKQLNVKVIYYDLEEYHHKDNKCILEPSVCLPGYENTACLVYLTEYSELLQESSIKACEKLLSLCDTCYLHVVKTEDGLVGVIATPELFKPISIKE